MKLKSELKTLNQAKTDLEQIEFKIESFVQFKIKNIEEKINNSFKFRVLSFSRIISVSTDLRFNFYILFIIN